MTIEQIYDIFKKCGKVSTDTRNIEPNSIFFALKGQKFDANEFVNEAFEKGAAYCVISDKKFFLAEKTILVDDTLKTLQQLAKYHRNQLKTKIIALTGSNGKTTTKELIYKVLSSKYSTIATQGNLNNHIGVPHTLIGIDNSYEFAVVEMGANHIGEIQELCQIAQPNCGLITNIGNAHIGTFGSFENLAKTKLALFEEVKNKGGMFFQNTSDKTIVEATSNYQNITKYGFSDDCFVRCLEQQSNVFLNLKVQVEGKHYDVKTQLIGDYNTDNVLCAIAVGLKTKVEIDKIIDAIATYKPSNNRSQLFKTDKNTLILDMYNANPASMESAIRNFSKSIFENKTLIIGDMLELGQYSAQNHQQIVELINSLNFQDVFLVGSEFYNCTNIKNAKKFVDVSQLCNYLKNNQLTNKTILIKGSNGINLKNCVEFL